MGESLPLAAIAAGALHLLFRSKLAARFSWIGFGLIYASLVIASISATNRYLEQKSILATDLRSTFESIKTSIDKGESPTKLPTFKSQGDSTPARMGAILQKILATSIEQRKRYEEEISATKWETILEPERIARDKDFSESFRIIGKAKSIVRRYQSGTDSLFLAMRLEIEGGDLDSEAKRGMLAGFDKSSPQGKSDANSLWDMEMEIVNTVEGMMVELIQNRSKWIVKDKQIIFTKQANLDSYRAGLDHINELSKKQDVIRQNSLKRSSEKLKVFD
ncbi:hypothetical protein H8K35_07925 [Undibacterium sp. LX40W]|uniref:Uncharacterized protein n=1 Tax=Undibacterium nitidum TaxID=2762298 RepID=A0A923KTI7_9BURK|nr:MULTISPECIES: hypothetical protein [Undibacterium]MBC3881639.1 hypothetical protein [Undibacterium nitidum]MBC3891578.1 hypothetical protein [Undibacterium sp. LX40W]